MCALVVPYLSATAAATPRFAMGVILGQLDPFMELLKHFYSTEIVLNEFLRRI